MVTEQLNRAGVTAQAPQGAIAPLVGHDVSSWILARLDGAQELTLDVEVDERFWRLRRELGASASVIELRLPVPLTGTEVAQAVLRWAAAEGLSARLEGEGLSTRVTLLPAN